jgi:hypothetical protein
MAEPYTNKDLADDYFSLIADRTNCRTYLEQTRYRVMAERISVYPRDIVTYYLKHGTLTGLPSNNTLGRKTKSTLEEILKKVKSGKHVRSKPRKLRKEYPLVPVEQPDHG